MSRAQHIRLYLWKNVLQKRRHPVATLCECSCPLILIGVMAYLYRISNLTYYPQQIWGLGQQSHDPGFQWLSPATSNSPFLAMPAQLLANNLVLAVAPGDGATRATVDQFVAKLDAAYPGVNFTKLMGPDPGLLDVPPVSAVVKYFDSDAAIDAYVTAPGYGNRDDPLVAFGLTVHSPAPNWDYAIRVNISHVPDPSQALNDDPTSKAWETQDLYFSNQGIGSSGFVPSFVEIQMGVDRALIGAQMNPNGPDYFNDLSSVAIGGVFALQQSPGSGPRAIQNFLNEHPVAAAEFLKSGLMAPQQFVSTVFPVHKYSDNQFYQDATSVLPFVMLIAFMQPVIRLILGLVREKETKIREGMRMMGLSDFSLFASWYITYFVLFFVIAVSLTVIGSIGLFEHSSPLLVFSWFFLLGTATTAFCFFISTFFNRAKTAAIIGTLIYTAAFFPYLAVQNPSVTVVQKMLTSLCAPAAFALSLSVMSAGEQVGMGITFDNWIVQRDNYSFAIGLASLLVDTILYTVLGWYCENVLPSEFGVRRPFYFCLTRSYWCGSRRPARRTDELGAPLLMPDVAGDHGATETAHIEPTPPALSTLELDNKVIRMRGLRKTFDTPDGLKVAVKGLDMTMYEGHITCLLGHNGAGKSTTISMLTGLIDPSAGSADVYGMDIATQMSEARQSMGVCPQHDVLFPDLSVREHLVLFAGFKGVDPKLIDAAVTDMISQVGLTEKTHARSKSLSGGQKRKLSVGIALIGGSKIVFLDEPTSGMDPYSRRSTWNLLRSNRAGRTIILTTHFLDEADLLGDRIAIMADGELRCLGSSTFLKQQYGVGYNLTLTLEEGAAAQPIVKVIKEHVAASKVLTQVGTEVSFQLPLAAAGDFPALLSDLDGHMEELRFSSYGIGVTTLEEVFLQVAREGNKKQHQLLREASHQLKVAADERRRSSADSDGGAAAHAGPVALDVEMLGAPGADDQDSFKRTQSLACSHFVSLFTKRLCNARRDKKAFVFQLVIPVVALWLGLALRNLAIAESWPEVTFSTSSFTNVDIAPVPYNSTASGKEWLSSIPSDAATLQNLGNLDPWLAKDPQLWKDAEQVAPPMPTSRIGLMTRAMDDYLLLTDSTTDAPRMASLIIPKEISKSHGPNGTIYARAHALLFQNGTANHAVPTYLNVLNDALLRWIHGGGSITTRNHPLPLTAAQEAIISQVLSIFSMMIITLAFAFIPASFVVFIVKEREVNAKHQQLVSGVSIYAYWLSNYLFDILSYIVPGGLSLLVIYGMDVKPFIEHGAFSATVAVFGSYGLSVASASYLMSYLFQKHSSAQNAVLFLQLLNLVMVIVSFVMQQITTGSCDTNESLRYIYMLFPGFLLGDALLKLALRPGLALLQVPCQYVTPFHNGDNVPWIPSKVHFTPWDAEVVGNDVFTMFILAGAYLFITVLIEFLHTFPGIRAFQPWIKDPGDPPMDIDEDVAAEAERVASGRADDDVIVLKHLRKVYGSILGRGKDAKVAVRNLSFGIPKGECFGFLGINGAGKTTTLKMLTGDTVATRGTAALTGLDIRTSQLETRRLLGYCPQFDALCPLLTVREHLEMYARIKGVARSDVGRLVDEKIETMQLSQYANKLAYTLSGGNKRKLSVAIAMIGDPPLMFLDEPSTGMDPVARRFMWEIIARMSRKCSIMLTTHSMEECEALCGRVGIMVGGRLRCLGSVQHLKQRFGRGYFLGITAKNTPDAHLTPIVSSLRGALGAAAPGGRLSRELLPQACSALAMPDRLGLITPAGSGWSVNASLDRDGFVELETFAEWWGAEDIAAGICHFVADTFPGAELVERQETTFRFKIAELSVPLGEAFALVEARKEELCMSHYALSQTTLEQIFNGFAAQQEEETGAVRGFTMRAPMPGGAAAPTGGATPPS